MQKLHFAREGGALFKHLNALANIKRITLNEPMK